MIRKQIDELQGNEVLGRTLMTSDYQIILPKGATLKKEYLQRLKELGVEEAYVEKEPEPIVQEEDEEIHPDMVILKSDIEVSAKNKVKEILERHTYKKNDELSELSNTADNIINNILSEDKIIEQVFDIKQRSSDLYEHSISVCSMAILTAIKLGLSKEQIHDIGIACLLHDIGLRYITVPFTERDFNELTHNEQSEYMKHPITGYSALNGEPWLSIAAKSIILFHHERMDGSGYPIRNKDLSIECRIVNICDAFDEMICGIGCKRVKVYEAIEYLKAFQNTKFDGKIVDVFLGFTAVYPSGTRVLTNEGEIGVVIAQNKGFQDRPIIRIEKDAMGNEPLGEVIKNLVKINHIFIEKALD